MRGTGNAYNALPRTCRKFVEQCETVIEECAKQNQILICVSQKENGLDK